MPPPITPSLLGRRLVVSGLAASAAGPLVPGTVGLAQTTSLLPTRGHVLDARGEPVPGAVVEIWQCDAFGRYRHPRDRQDAGAIRASRGAGVSPRGRTAPMPSALSGRCRTRGEHRISTRRWQCPGASRL